MSSLHVRTWLESRRRLLAISLTSLVAWIVWDHQRSAPRRQAFAIATELDQAILSKESRRILDLVTLPPSATATRPEDQGKWLATIFADEINAAGIEEMRRHAQFGSLSDLFPETADRWARGAGVAVGNCAALKMERAGIRAEIVFHKSPDGLRILRCNNVNQMASPIPEP